jgi:hypothetical protein
LKEISVNTAYTIFGHDSNLNQDFCLHVDMPRATQQEVWMHVLRHCGHYSGLKDLRLEDVDSAKEELGDDLMDYNITAVLPGIHTCIYAELPEG